MACSRMNFTFAFNFNFYVFRLPFVAILREKPYSKTYSLLIPENAKEGNRNM